MLFDAVVSNPIFVVAYKESESQGGTYNDVSTINDNICQIIVFLGPNHRDSFSRTLHNPCTLHITEREERSHQRNIDQKE